MGFFRQEYWSRLPRPPPRDLPDPRTEPTSITPPALAARFFITSTTQEAQEQKVTPSNPPEESEALDTAEVVRKAEPFI